MNKHSFALTAVLACLLLLLLGIYLPLGGGAKIEFTINQGDGSAKVARLLAEQGIVRSRYLFIGYTVLAGKEKSFKAGKYTLSRSMNIPEVVGIFSEGKAESEGVLVTLPEGSNSWDMVVVLGQSFKNLKVADFQKYEGYLFPDTYYFGDSNDKTQMTNKTQNPNNQTSEIIKKMRVNFDSKTSNLKLVISDLKFREAVIVASILEKEVKTEEDMGLVAGIIYKRLKMGMPLQIDATVAYGACRPSADIALPDIASLVPSPFVPRPSADIPPKYCDVTQVNLIENIKIDGPYNTYTRKGLPAGPISNPGLKALNAALNPVVSDYFYYLSTKDGSQTVFSKTSAEHQRNRAKYLK